LSELPDGTSVSSGAKVNFDWLPDLNTPINILKEKRHCINVLRRHFSNIDALIIRASSQGWIGASEATKQYLPWAVEVVGDPWDAYWNYGNVKGKLYAPIAWWHARKWISKASFAIYVTREQLQKRYPCHGVTTNASNVEVLTPNREILISRLKLISEKGNHSVKCGMIGSLFNRYKGLHIALDSLKQLRNLGIDVELHVLGEGKHEQWMREATQYGVSDLLHLDGRLPAGEPVLNWLDNLDFYIQPSLTEGLPRSLIEAMSRGLPALASTCGGIPELLPPECLHQPGNSTTLTKQMMRMAKDKSWMEQLARRNFEEAKQYDANVINQRRDAFWAQFAEYARQQSSKPCVSS
jgi:glycosyltransferase involved in cell wall biosynthesis